MTHDSLETKVELILQEVGYIKKDISDIKKKLETNYITVKEGAERDRRISDLEDQAKWVVRLVLGAVITAALGFFLVK